MEKSEKTFLLHGKPVREYILKLVEKSNKKFITIKTSIYITIIFTKEIIP